MHYRNPRRGPPAMMAGLLLALFLAANSICSYLFLAQRPVIDHIGGRVPVRDGALMRMAAFESRISAQPGVWLTAASDQPSIAARRMNYESLALRMLRRNLLINASAATALAALLAMMGLRLRD